MTEDSIYLFLTFQFSHQNKIHHSNFLSILIITGPASCHLCSQGRSLAAFSTERTSKSTIFKPTMILRDFSIVVLSFWRQSAGVSAVDQKRHLSVDVSFLFYRSSEYSYCDAGPRFSADFQSQLAFKNFASNKTTIKNFEKKSKVVPWEKSTEKEVEKSCEIIVRKNLK